jgi:ribosomal protein S12
MIGKNTVAEIDEKKEKEKSKDDTFHQNLRLVENVNQIITKIYVYNIVTEKGCCEEMRIMAPKKPNSANVRSQR